MLAVLDATATARYNLGLCLNLIISYITPGLIFGGLLHGRSFPSQKFVPKRTRVYFQGSLFLEFYGTLEIKHFHSLPFKTKDGYFVGFRQKPNRKLHLAPITFTPTQL